jgi:hypothetical protein
MNGENLEGILLRPIYIFSGKLSLENEKYYVIS